MVLTSSLVHLEYEWEEIIVISQLEFYALQIACVIRNKPKFIRKLEKCCKVKSLLSVERLTKGIQVSVWLLPLQAAPQVSQLVIEEKR